MPKYWIRKQGRQHSVYQTPFTDYDQPPEGGEFAITIEAESIAQLEAQIGTKDYVLIGPPARGSKEARACATDGHLPQVKPAEIDSNALLANGAALNIPREKLDEMAAQRTQGSATVAPASGQIGVGALLAALGPMMAAKAEGRIDRGSLAQATEGGYLQDKALLEYRMLAIRCLVATPNDTSALLPIRKFILKLFPDVAEQLAQIEREEA